MIAVKQTICVRIIRLLCYVTVLVCLCFCCALRTGVAYGAEATEYDIKAVYIYNFILFTTWPFEEDSDASRRISGNENGDVIRLGIVGEDPFGDSFSEVENKLIRAKKRRFLVRRYGPYRPGMDFSDCEVLFISASERDHFDEVIGEVAGLPILTISDSDGFLEAGGMINLVTVGNKVRWEINKAAVDEGGLRLSAQLFSSAVRVVMESKQEGESRQPQVIDAVSFQEAAADHGDS